MSRPLIPQKMTNHKLKIWKSVNLWDFLFTVLFLGAAVGMYFSLAVVTSIFFRIFLAFFTFLVLESFILPVNSSGKRVYQLIFDSIRFKASTKKYFFNESVQTSQLLIPYEKVVNDVTIKNHKFDGKPEYIQGFKVTGFDIFNLAPDNQNQKIRSLWEMFIAVESNMSLIKSDQPLNLKDYEIFLKEQVIKLKHNRKITKDQRQARIEQLQETLALFADGQDLDSEQPEKNFFFVLYNTDLKRLNEEIAMAMNHAKRANLKVNQLLNFELLNLFKELIEPSNFEFTAEDLTRNDNVHQLDRMLALKEITFGAKFYKTAPDFYRNISVVSDYPVTPSRGWMYGLMNTDATVVVNISNPKTKAFEKQLNRTIQNVKSNLVGIPEKEATKIAKLEKEITTYEEIVFEVGQQEEKFKKINTYYILSGRSLKELRQKQKEHSVFLKQDGIKIDYLTFKQQEGFSGFIPKSFDPLTKEFDRDTTAITLAEAFPFISKTIKEEGGFYFGRTSTGDVVILDQYKNLKNTDSTRKNANMVIMGQAGSGKTVTSSTIVSQHLSLGRKGFIIDPEGDYKSIAREFGGKWIDVGTGSEGRINPLQIMSTLETDEQVNRKTLNKMMISNHISFLESFFKVLYPENSDEENRYLAKLAGVLYKEKDFMKKNLRSLKVEEWPVIDDLIKTFENEIKVNDHLPETLHYKMLSLLKDDFTEFGKLTNIYNGHSTLKTSNNGLVVFDIATLFETTNNAVIQAQMMLITAFIQNELKSNWKKSKEEIFILIDEAHLLINPRYPVALDFIWQMSKRIRKRRGAVILITQNPDDFVSTPEVSAKTKAIINNSQYLLVMSLSSENLTAVDIMFKEFGGLTPNQMEFLAFADKGQGLLFTSNFERYNITIKPIQKVRENFIENQLKEN